MAKYTKKEVAEITGKPVKTVNAWCSPSKKSLVLDADGCVDTALEKNKRFLDRKILEKEQGVKLETFRGAKKRVRKKPEDKEEVKNIEQVQVVNPIVEQMNEFDRKKQELQIQKMEADIRKKELEIEREEGDYIKTEDVIELIRSWSEARDKELCKMIEREIKYICDRESIAPDKTGRYVNKVPGIINEASAKAEERIQQSLK